MEFIAINIRGGKEGLRQAIEKLSVHGYCYTICGYKEYARLPNTDKLDDVIAKIHANHSRQFSLLLGEMPCKKELRLYIGHFISEGGVYELVDVDTFIKHYIDFELPGYKKVWNLKT